MANPIDNYVKTLLTSYTVIIVVALLIGAAVGPAVSSALFQSDDEGTIAAVTIQGPISGPTADEVTRQLRTLRTDDSIDAVVLRIDSGGGSVAASEAQYRAVKRLAREKPVVTSVRGVAASGAYYTALPSDEIYATPGGLVGSVGVRALIPQPDGVPRSVTTGPDKAGGLTGDDIRGQVETLKRSFVDSVYAERGDRLSLSRTELTNAKVYSGAAAVDNGLADEIGGLETAIAAAAEKAGLDSYDVVYRSTTPGVLSLLLGSDANSTDAGQVDRASLLTTRGIERPQYLMLWGDLNTSAREVRASGAA
ncbi:MULTISPECIES: S49 family peptidase [Halomicrobium]|uniref:Peptidase S49 n=2 Tax=Halomicrobium mukohataei TaxID=57705 RepID=C7NWJ4_HALMD|nr:MULTISPECIES: S49 family peptidase [Halomicrobium]ACV46335.1 peptidase S49 [Halomicrobium mukohataei DSM 12286]QCD64891.1 S49 family peptidase [Halomicrobium mukohataei]QFR19697.1 S49 family peptidase [Halomicrobium sp. ZPS1]